MENVNYNIWNISPYTDVDTKLRRNTYNIASDNYEIVLDMPHDVYGVESIISFMYYQNKNNELENGEMAGVELKDIVSNEEMPEEVSDVLNTFVLNYLAEEQMMEYEVEYGYRNADGSIPDEKLFRDWRESEMYADIYEKFLNN